MDVLYSDNVVTWDELKLPMHEVSATGKWHDFNALVEDHTESESVKDSDSAWSSTKALKSCHFPVALTSCMGSFSSSHVTTLSEYKTSILSFLC